MINKYSNIYNLMDVSVSSYFTGDVGYVPHVFEKTQHVQSGEGVQIFSDTYVPPLRWLVKLNHDLKGWKYKHWKMDSSKIHLSIPIQVIDFVGSHKHTRQTIRP